MISRTGILFIIVCAQFACVSLWFAGNGVMDALISDYDLPPNMLGHLTSSVQIGFITGTLLYAIFAFADKYSPSKVFFISALAASLANLGLVMAEGSVVVLYSTRFMTGFFLAGIYPVGMKIAADYFDKDLGKALGYLLGALVLGTAFPHLLKSVLNSFRWENVVIFISVLSIVGGMLIFFLVPDGPYRKKGSLFDKKIVLHLFRDKNFRAAAFGYFGHMWELYAFWTFIPVILTVFIKTLDPLQGDVSRLTFYIISAGSIGCILGGYISKTLGSYRVALLALAGSAFCCLVSPLIFTLDPSIIFLFLLAWGMVVIMDSPQFSTLVAQTAPADNKGSALTFVNCIGFTITIFSIQLLNLLNDHILHQWLLIFLLPGPVLGLIAMMQWKGQGRII